MKNKHRKNRQYAVTTQTNKHCRKQQQQQQSVQEPSFSDLINSLDKVTDKQSFWNSQHDNNNPYWLTGSDPKTVLSQHNVLDAFKNAKTFLDIGVGMGNMSKYCKSQNKFVIACDISDIALNKLSNIVDKRVYTNEIKTIEPIDLAVCHLVFQHCDDETIKNIINDTPLKDGAILSFQFASPIDNNKLNGNVCDLINLGTHYIRSKQDIENIVSNTNKKIIGYAKHIDFKSPENLRWHFCKVCNK